MRRNGFYNSLATKSSHGQPSMFLFSCLPVAVVYGVCCEMLIFQWVKRGGRHNEFYCLAQGLKHLHTEKKRNSFAGRLMELRPAIY
uniref:Uncharacterized protein n=1 Tax=Anopheles atroparvus TaxID=41427 RepID=A0AAG5DFR7_ANOAO